MAFNSTPKDINEQNINGLLGSCAEWVRIELKNIASVINGYAFKSSEFNSNGIGHRLIRIRDVLKGDTETYYSGEVPDGYWVARDDIVIGMDGDFNIARWNSDPALLNQRVCKIDRLSEFFDKRLLFRLLPGYLDAINANTSSTTVKHLSSKTLEGLLLPLPSLAEQKVIAEKLETLLVQVDNTKGRLERIPEILKRFRQSVLAAAVSGKLTEEWRGSIDYETKGSKLLPIKWGVEAAKDVCIKVQSGSTPRDNPFDQNGTIPFLKVYNIVNQKIDFDYKPQFVTEDVHKAALKRSIAEPNDILMNIVGPPLGKVAVLTDQYPEWNLNQAITLFRVEPSKLNHLFLYHVLCEGELVREVMPDTKGSVGQVNISLSQCRDALLPVPPLEEQSEIVRRVEELFAFADRIEHAAQAALSRVNNLTQSILAKAFRGELTADWRAANPELISGENSAEALLARIKAERAKVKPKPKKANE